jgi:hypothetical protein
METLQIKLKKETRGEEDEKESKERKIKIFQKLKYLGWIHYLVFSYVRIHTHYHFQEYVNSGKSSGMAELRVSVYNIILM